MKKKLSMNINLCVINFQSISIFCHIRITQEFNTIKHRFLILKRIDCIVTTIFIMERK